MNDRQERVAVITVHGVGDPRPGDTAGALAALLVAQRAYEHQGQGELLVQVQPVHPGSVAAAPPRWNSPYTSAFTAQRLAREAPADPHEDLHAGLSRHLIEGTELEDSERIYSARCVRLRNAKRRVDVWDLYWGDLSGLDGAVGRIIAELYTLIFHLCQLGRDTVHHMAIHARNIGEPHRLARKSLSLGQQWADALLTKPSGVLNALLILMALWWFPLARVAADTPMSIKLGLGGSALLALGAALAWRYRPESPGRRALAGSCVAGLLIACVLAARAPEAMVYVVALLWLATLSGLFAAFLAFCEPRVRGVQLWGWTGLVGMYGLMAWGMRLRLQKPIPLDRPASFDWLAQAAGAAIEGLTLALLVVWTAMALSVIVVVTAGTWLKLVSRDPTIVRSVDTGRIGLYASIALFITLTVAAWTLVMPSLREAFGGAQYQPLRDIPNAPRTVADFAQLRFNEASLTFSIVLMVLLLLLLWLVAVLAPSIAAEFRHRHRQDGTRLGRWLSATGAALTAGATRIIWINAVFFLAWAAYANGMTHCDEPAPGLRWYEPLCGGMDQVRRLSVEWKSMLLTLVAGSAAGLIVIGARVFGALGKLRMPLDIALDVDKHFREFPAHATPRGRIAARTLSLLDAMRERCYDRVVLVAHSQGTIIVTELLRYLQATWPERLAGMPDIYLFTCGCPLRQLYEARFPALYPWAREQHDTQVVGPKASQLGVRRWTNAYCTGDYVGRWVWHLGTIQAELLATGLNFNDGTHRQVCLGKGAHTHYFDTGMQAVAHEIDALIAGSA